MSRYSGRPWRSRFLRAPKLALDIAAMGSFVPLSEVATVTLGLKTGADSFFFVEPVEPPPAGLLFGAEAGRREVVVRGRNGWTGSVAAKDLLPVIRNPHELITDSRRAFTIPRQTEALYLFPRARQPDGDLAEYIKRAVEDGVHQSALVRSNADPLWWFRQVRAVVRPVWALPYNSAYDYVAWENPARAVINGRFVGVEPGAGVPSDMLGAVLNSTFVATTRLLEGVATGVEGAFDVGPPAARLVRIPDPQLLMSRQDAIAAVLAELRRANSVPSAPSRDAVVDPLRNRLDTEIARALGLGPGAAATLVGRLYESYARWRQAVEDVETAMRANRRAAARAGTQRGESPSQMAARQVWEHIASGMRLIPRDLVGESDKFETVAGTRQVRIPEQTPIFDPGEVLMSDGRKVDLGSWERVRYLKMLVDLGFQPPYLVPTDPARADEIADAFEVERGAVRASARQRALAFAASRDLDQVVELVERLWHRDCRAAGLGHQKEPVLLN